MVAGVTHGQHQRFFRRFVMSNVIGSCSVCGGNVVVHSMEISPVPTCQKCGARAKRNVIEMEPRPPATTPVPLRGPWSGYSGRDTVAEDILDRAENDCLDREEGYGW